MTVTPSNGSNVMQQRWTPRNLLGIGLVLSLITNIWLLSNWNSDSSLPDIKSSHSLIIDGPAKILKTCKAGPCADVASLDHLVMVPCHAVYIGSNLSDSANENNWYLEQHQKGQVDVYLSHIRQGIQMLREEGTILVFSGGQTRLPAGHRSEASSYWLVADSMLWFGFNETLPDLPNRVTTEEFAKDSFENLLFSICRFREFTGRYPRRITVVGFEFKRRRFESLHRRAIQFPMSQFDYKGFDPPGTLLEESELVHAVRPFEKDPYGCHQGSLLDKKIGRNPFNRYPPYEKSCPEIRHLLAYCPDDKTSLFTGKLPWL
ncbi:hypothetical protein SmJEL517_g01196 [Synchytrium microbalum]|uniref:DUF218 domain-containing protein n=1 Tax=Synchytrium microbalum TaxID=1806994 RepID=A0A507CFB3_9FUNG|nr:uncharacterized protein SmJEL517_g01196 [Synchytrium microbalum]TPX36676.1 hypothetical protein SmJEL517_g01196 [Synchytrium microbalum]